MLDEIRTRFALPASAGPLVRCSHCRSEIRSMNPHDIMWCSCRNICVSGGNHPTVTASKSGSYSYVDECTDAASEERTTRAPVEVIDTRIRIRGELATAARDLNDAVRRVDRQRSCETPSASMLRIAIADVESALAALQRCLT